MRESEKKKALVTLDDLQLLKKTIYEVRDQVRNTETIV